jgi:hypothetical protein
MAQRTHAKHLNIAEAAQILGVSAARARKLFDEGYLSGFRLGSSRRRIFLEGLVRVLSDKKDPDDRVECLGRLIFLLRDSGRYVDLGALPGIFLRVKWPNGGEILRLVLKQSS